MSNKIDPNNDQHDNEGSVISNTMKITTDHQQQRQLHDDFIGVDPSLLSSMNNLSLNTPGGEYSRNQLESGDFKNGYNYPQSINQAINSSSNLNFVQDWRSMFQQTPVSSSSSSRILNSNLTQYSTSSIHQESYPFSNIVYQDKLVMLAKDSYYSLSVLQYFRESDGDTKQSILDVVTAHLHELAVHKVGCNFLTRLFHDCDQHQRRKIVLLLASDTLSLIPLACHLHGTHLIQKVIKSGKNLPDIARFPHAFADYLVYMMTDKIGRHVLQQCFVFLDSLKNKPLYDGLLGDWFALAIDKQGCIALNESVSHMNSMYKYLLLHSICKEAIILSQDTYGTHVVQNILDMRMPIFAKEIVTQLKTLYERLSRTQRGSYIVEKCLKTEYMPIVVIELLNSRKLVTLAQDQYGNFVIQEALRQTKEREAILYQELCRELCKEMGTLESGPYGRNVAKLLKQCTTITR